MIFKRIETFEGLRMDRWLPCLYKEYNTKRKKNKRERGCCNAKVL